MKRVAFCITLFVAMAGTPADVRAYTCPWTAFQEDQSVFFAAGGGNAGPQNQIQYYNDLMSQYLLTDGSWDSAGRNSLDPTKPVTMMAEAVTLLFKGHWDTWVGWHPNGQWIDEFAPFGSHGHDNIRWHYNDSDDGFTEAKTYYNVPLVIDLHTDYTCRGFGTNDSLNASSERASIAVHEAWHAYLWDHEYNPNHMDTGCAAGTGACDRYYPHGLLDYRPGGASGGDLYYSVDGSRFFHSAYQAGVEYQCDIAEEATPWVPTVTRSQARLRANFRTTNNFVNAVGWVCGQPLPFF